MAIKKECRTKTILLLLSSSNILLLLGITSLGLNTQNNENIVNTKQAQNKTIANVDF